MAADEMLEVTGLLYGPFNDTDKRPTLAQVEEMLRMLLAQAADHDRRITDLLNANNAEVERRQKAEKVLRDLLAWIAILNSAESPLRRHTDQIAVESIQTSCLSGPIFEAARSTLAKVENPAEPVNEEAR